MYIYIYIYDGMVYHIPGMMIHFFDGLKPPQNRENVIQILLETEPGFGRSSGIRDPRIHGVISWLGIELDRSLKLKVIQSWYRYGG